MQNNTNNDYFIQYWTKTFDNTDRKGYQNFMKNIVQILTNFDYKQMQMMSLLVGKLFVDNTIKIGLVKVLKL